jgi:hypothetical protein
MIEMEDGSFVMSHPEPMIYLCGFKGVPSNENLCEVMSDRTRYVSWADGLDLVYIFGTVIKRLRGNSRYWSVPKSVRDLTEAPSFFEDVSPLEYDINGEPVDNVGSEERL